MNGPKELPLSGRIGTPKKAEEVAYIMNPVAGIHLLTQRQALDAINHLSGMLLADDIMRGPTTEEMGAMLDGNRGRRAESAEKHSRYLRGKKSVHLRDVRGVRRVRP